MNIAGYSRNAPWTRSFRPLAAGIQGILLLLLLLLLGTASVIASNRMAMQATTDAAPTVTALFPANGATAMPVDVPLKITFNAAPTLATSGLIQIHDASTGAVTDTIDLGAAPQTKSIAGTVYNYFPVIISGNTALITPHVTLA